MLVREEKKNRGNYVGMGKEKTLIWESGKSHQVSQEFTAKDFLLERATTLLSAAS